MTPEIGKRINRLSQNLILKRPWGSVIIFILNLLIAIPLFIIIHQNIPDPQWSFNTDRVLVFIVLLLIIQLILWFLKKIIIVCIALYLIVLISGTMFGGYGLGSMLNDYKVMIFAMAEDPNPQDIIISKLLPFPNKARITKAIDFANPQVRNFALFATTKHFRGIKGYQKYRQIIQSFAIFKEIQNNWNYVNDPKGQEYIAYASESLQHFSGDCDDHAVLMAACIRAIGGTPRLIHTQAHIYPEMLIGDENNLETVIYLIKEVLFVEESKGKEIHFHIDERGHIWLNLDYTAKYPGGPFMSKEILGALTLN